VPITGYILVAVAAYLAGSIPTGFLAGKARGIDIRSVGSGNIGATNAFRALGAPLGVAVLLVDALKGWVAVVAIAPLVGHWFPPPDGQTLGEWPRIVAGLAALLGHNYTCWLRFKGGKGISTSAGVLLALVPTALLVILIVFLVVLGLTRYVSLASISASFTLPFATWFTLHDATLTAVTGGMAALAIFKHKSNIKRLLNGTESRVGSKKPPADS
jgi:acyl phosphate:glycerol-3-phosphate acyltransferase